MVKHLHLSISTYSRATACRRKPVSNQVLFLFYFCHVKFSTNNCQNNGFRLICIEFNATEMRRQLEQAWDEQKIRGKFFIAGIQILLFSKFSIPDIISCSCMWCWLWAHAWQEIIGQIWDTTVGWVEIKNPHTHTHKIQRSLSLVCQLSAVQIYDLPDHIHIIWIKKTCFSHVSREQALRAERPGIYIIWTVNICSQKSNE